MGAKADINNVRILLCIVFTLLFSFGNNTEGFSSTEYYTLAEEYGQKGALNNPRSVAVDSDGYIYVADSSNYRIQKFTSDGTFVTMWGSKGSGDGQFRYVNNIAVGSKANVYVVDYYNYRIQKFTSDGSFVAKWGSQGSGDGQFKSLNGITVDGNGYVYVADGGNNRIQKFTSDGTFVAKWGNLGSGYGQFYHPDNIAVDGNGCVYVSDDYYRIQKFTSDGTFLTQWGKSGSGDGQFGYYLGGITVDSEGYVYVNDTNSNDRIQKFTSDGTFVTKWDVFVPGDDEYTSHYGIAMDHEGYVYIAASIWPTYTASRIKKFTNNGTYVMHLGWAGPGSYGGIALDLEGNMYLPDANFYRVLVLGADGVFVTEWGSAGVNDGEFGGELHNKPFHGVAMDKNDLSIYVVDAGNYRVQKFGNNRMFLTKWGSQGSGDGQFISPKGIAVDDEGYVYVADSYNHRIQKFTSDGTFVAKWGSQGTGDGWFSGPEGIAVDDEGYVYVADSYNHRIQKFTSDGTFVTKWGSYGSGDGQFIFPKEITVDSEGYVYVGDGSGSNSRIQKFTSDGSFVIKWSTGSTPTGIAVDSDGYVYVTYGSGYGSSSGNANRIQKFRKVHLPDAPVVKGKTPTNDTTPTWTWTSGGGGNGTYRYRLDNSDLSTGATVTTAKSFTPTSALTESIHTLYVQECNSAGDYSVSGFKTIKIDTTPPDTSVTGKPTRLSNSKVATFSFTSTEADSTFQCRLDSGAYAACTSPKAYSGLADGSHTFNVKAMDKAGNTDLTPAAYTWKIDTTSPTGTIKINKGADYTSSTAVTLNLTCNDGTGSGCAKMRFSNDNANWSAEENFAASKAWPLTSEGGNKTVYLKLKDMAGNLSTALNDTIILDITTPTLGALAPAAITTEQGKPQTFTAVYSDADGYANLNTAYLLVSPSGGTANAIRTRYDRADNKLYLYNDAGTGTVSGSCTPGQATTLANSQGTLNCAQTTVTGSGTNLTVKWNLTPKLAFASTTAKQVRMNVKDNSGLTTGWVKKGSWTITTGSSTAALDKKTPQAFGIFRYGIISADVDERD